MYQTHFQCCLLYTASFSKQVWGGALFPSLQHRLNFPNVAYNFMMHKLISWHSASSVVVIFLLMRSLFIGDRGGNVV